MNAFSNVFKVSIRGDSFHHKNAIHRWLKKNKCLSLKDKIMSHLNRMYFAADNELFQQWKTNLERQYIFEFF